MQRELSAKLTEGLFYEVINIFTNTSKVFMYFRIRYSYNCQSVFFEKSGSFFIVLLSFFRIMPRTVKLYDELCLCTVKIRNIPSENLLTRKTNRIGTQKSYQRCFSSFVIFFRNIFAVGTISLLCFLCITIPPSRYRVPPPFTQGRLWQVSTDRKTPPKKIPWWCSYFLR